MDARSTRWLCEEEERASDRKALERAAKAQWVTFVRSLAPWNTWSGLTVDSTRLNHAGRLRDAVLRRWAENWLASCTHWLKRDIKAIGGIERMPGGQPHVHVNLLIPDVTQKDRAKIAQIWYRRHGIAYVEEIQNSEEDAYRVVRYLTKQFHLDRSVLIEWNIGGRLP